MCVCGFAVKSCAGRDDTGNRTRSRISKALGGARARTRLCRLYIYLYIYNGSLGGIGWRKLRAHEACFYGIRYADSLPKNVVVVFSQHFLFILYVPIYLNLRFILRIAAGGIARE